MGMRMNDFGYFYRPRFPMPPMTEEEAMGPYYGMGRESSDVLQSYSTQIVPPQELFGLGQDKTDEMSTGMKVLLVVLSIAAGYGVVRFIQDMTHA
jgi:hypothetical protein